jgi:prepilin-type N-terminal cleavage/methylation domain-containing protein
MTQNIVSVRFYRYPIEFTRINPSSREWQRNRTGDASMQHRRNAGYSLSEVLIVVAIIGVLSLITVPVFMNFQRAGIFKSAMRTVSTDLRSARANAIKTSSDIRVEFITGTEGPTTKEYRAYSSTDGVTWVAMSPRRAFTSAGADGTGDMVKRLSGPVWMEGFSNLTDIGTDGKPDIVFHPDGTANVAGVAANGYITLATNWTNIFTNRYNIYVTRSGQVKALPCQCMDGIDNDGDGQADKNGVDTNKDGTNELSADAQCTSKFDNDEAA